MKTLIVVDMQYDFITGPLGTPEAQAIVPKVKEKIEQYKANGYDVIFTYDTHDEDYMKTEEGKHLPVPHCIYRTPGWCIHEDLYTVGDKYIEKPTFGYKDWAYVNSLYNSEIELVGVCTDICVVSNALILKSLYPEKKISVHASCCAGTTPEAHLAALRTMQSCQIDITNL